MRKPGATFAFEPKNNLNATHGPAFPTSPKKKRLDLLLNGEQQKTKEQLRQSFYDLFQATTITLPATPPYTTNTKEHNDYKMARSRSESFGDYDLFIIGSQSVSSQEQPISLTSSPVQQQPQSPAPAANNRSNNAPEIIDLSNSPALRRDPSAPSARPKTSTSVPAFGAPTQLHSAFNRKPTSVFNQPRNRVEHHRDLYRVTGPLAPKYENKRAAPTQLFSSVGPSSQSLASPVKKSSGGYGGYGGGGGAGGESYQDQIMFTDPAKANEQLKALLEGGMEEDDDEEEQDNKAAAKDNKTTAEKLDDGTVEGIKVKLLPHQVEGLAWMRSREIGPIKKGKLPKGGILADDMGLGKTLQSVSLIITNPRPASPESKGWKDRFEHIGKGTLVVAPLALIRQWEAEIKDKVTRDHALKVYVHHGPNRTKSFKELARYDVVITTYQILVSEHGHSSPDPEGVQAGCFGLYWYRVILDEAHSIKNRNAKATKACCALRAEYRWCLTGTPMQNNLDELQSLIHFLRIPPYDDLAEWRAHIDVPMKKGKGHIAIRRLHSLLRCFMKRRTKDVLKEEGALVAGGKKALERAVATAKKEGKEVVVPKSAFKITERRVVTIATEFSPAEREFYDALEARADKSLEKMMKGKVSYATALVLLLRLRQACNHPRLTQSKADQDKDALALAESQVQEKTKVEASDLDDLADAFGGMGIKTRQCEMCLNDLSRQEVDSGDLRCAACVGSLEKLSGETPDRRRPKKKGRRVSVVAEEIKVEESRRRKPRGRNIVMDSDDDDDEADEGGSWLVGEDQRGSLRLGKAGGTDDEDAEGGGDSIGPDHSDTDTDEADEEDTNLSSFVVDDGPVKDEDAPVYSGDDSDNETFVSVHKIHSQMLSQKTGPSDSDKSASDASDLSDASQSDPDSDSDSDGSLTRHRSTAHRRGPKPRRSDALSAMSSAKIRELISIVKAEVREHKFIIFSQFTTMLDMIEPFFRSQEGFKFVRYDGGMKNDMREASLHALRNDPHTRILLCSLKCGSLGLNLTAATRVVILEPFWNPFVEEQAIDRVHRLTQTIDVIIYKLTVKDTVEERILELQNKKRMLAQATIEGGMKKKDKNELKLGLQEIMDLFRHDARGSNANELLGEGGAGAGEGKEGDVGEIVRSMKQITKKKGPAESGVYGRRW